MSSDQLASAWASVQAGVPVPGVAGATYAFEGDRTASGVPMFNVRIDGAFAGEVTRLGQGRWAWMAVVNGEAVQGEATNLPAARVAVAKAARL